MQAVTVRLPEETYERLEAFADTHGESMSDSARRGIEQLLSGPPAPPPPGPAPDPGEIAELRRRLEELAGREEETRRYVGDLAWRLNEVQGAVNRIVAMLGPALPGLPPPFPPFPGPPWSGG